MGSYYEENALGFPARGVGVFLAERDESFGEALGFFGFVPGGADGFVFEEGGDEVAEVGWGVGGGGVVVAVFSGATGLGFFWGRGGGRGMGGDCGCLAHVWEDRCL